METGKKVLLDFAMFAGTVFFAWYNRWAVADLAWSLWISSLTLGYLYVLVSAVGTLVHGPAAIFKSKPSEKPEKPPQHPIVSAIAPVAVMLFFLTGFTRFTLYLLPYALLIVFSRLAPILRQKQGWGFLPNVRPVVGDVLIALPILIFMLAFFTVHFGGFHMVHGMFLNRFFPMVPEAVSTASLGGEIRFFAGLILTAFSRYWFFILMSGFNSWKACIRAFKVNDGSMMFKPYLNVIRMHVMIFLFAIMNAFRLQGLALYLMLALYFFPVGSLVDLFRAKKIRSSERAS